MVFCLDEAPAEQAPPVFHHPSLTEAHWASSTLEETRSGSAVVTEGLPEYAGRSQSYFHQIYK